ncbi:MAG: hypothetical protein DRJ96_07635, partial [Thermoprotei archaeon]
MGSVETVFWRLLLEDRGDLVAVAINAAIEGIISIEELEKMGFPQDLVGLVEAKIMARELAKKKVFSY